MREEKRREGKRSSSNQIESNLSKANIKLIRDTKVIIRLRLQKKDLPETRVTSFKIREKT
jgi:hypothetical protein